MNVKGERLTTSFVSITALARCGRRRSLKCWMKDGLQKIGWGRSLNPSRPIEKSTSMLCTGASLLVNKGICCISSAISSQLGAWGAWGQEEMEVTHSTESSLSCVRLEEGLYGSRWTTHLVEKSLSSGVELEPAATVEGSITSAKVKTSSE